MKTTSYGGKMTTFRIDTHKKSGEVRLWMEAGNRFIPIIGWDGIEGVKQFATMLLDFCEHREEKKEERNKVKEVSNSLLRQALGNDKYCK